MTYDSICAASFIDRPNRFIANVLLDGHQVTCHVKNTGRCRELFIPGCEVFLQHVPDPSRKTQWDLIAVKKGSRIVNVDSSAPNKVFHEWLPGGGLGFIPDFIKPEIKKDDSRFDFYFEASRRRAFCEVKGVTLEVGGAAKFPDAPTIRGVRHLDGLCRCVREGFEAYAVFIIQMEGVSYFEPNAKTHPEFAASLRRARNEGVNIIALDCSVWEQGITARSLIETRI